MVCKLFVNKLSHFGLRQKEERPGVPGRSFCVELSCRVLQSRSSEHLCQIIAEALAPESRIMIEAFDQIGLIHYAAFAQHVSVIERGAHAAGILTADGEV